MVWYAKSPYFANSGGVYLNGGNTVPIDGQNYLVKYKIEHASSIDFYYASFTMNKEPHQLTNNGQMHKLPTVNYKRIAEYVTDGRLQKLLDDYEASGKTLDKMAGDSKVVAPTSNYVLSHIDFG